MSYQNVFFGFLKPHLYFNSRKGDVLDGTEKNTYLPESFVGNTLLTEKEFNIGFHIIVYNPNSVGVTFYLTKEKTHHGEDIRINLDNSVAHIQTHIDRGEDKVLTIQWLGVNEKFRGGGLGEFLITLALLYTSIFDSSVEKVLLDDASDKYANGIYVKTRQGRSTQSKNIYCKMGFVYKDETGGPEMTAKVKEILKQNLSHTELEPEPESEPEPAAPPPVLEAPAEEGMGPQRSGKSYRYHPYRGRYKKKKHTKRKKKRKSTQKSKRKSKRKSKQRRKSKTR